MTRVISVGLFIILICCATYSSAAVPALSLEDKLQELEIRLETKVIQLQEKVTQLQTQLELNSELRKDLTLKVNQLEAKNVQLEDKVQEQEKILTSLLQAAERSLSAGGTGTVALTGLPTSCEDLSLIGHTLNGFYSVMGSSLMESVYCDFTKLPSDAGFQKWIGYADVKSAPVHFYVQRNDTLYTYQTPIPFHLARVNEGNAMDLASGIFTAPRTGIYFFAFTGVVEFPTAPFLVHLRVGLYVNGNSIGTGYVEQTNTATGENDQVTLQSTLNLEKDDQVWVQINSISAGVYLLESSNHFTHFTGFMLEEEIVASL